MLGVKKYNIILEPVVLSIDLKKISSKNKDIIKKSIQQKLTSYPELYSFPLRKLLGNYRKLRVGKYRVIFRIDIKKKECLIIGIRHREDIYQKISKRLNE
ncbi:type II toxin-antitoxin system RelE/ParE family toxin [Patescibacteria group bacterium]|nr:type II toxin-antitoxin system RelE/ParE family toxin [Patescibacteria group bacterium]